MEKINKQLENYVDVMSDLTSKLKELGIRIEIDSNEEGIDIKLRKWKK